MAQLKNTLINDTGFLQLPSGTTAQRPASPTAGMVRFNTTTSSTEWYDGVHGAWFPTGVVPPAATGGTITNITQGGVNYRVHSFTTTGTNTFTVTRGGQAEFLIVAGGGGGGRGSNYGGGGGAGGVLQGFSLLSLGSYNIFVGAGGAGATASLTRGTNGQSSSALGFTSIGGGGGGAQGGITQGISGGSGGGSGYDSPPSAGGLGTPGQGNNGASGNTNPNAGGGGGGAGAPGKSQSPTDGGNGFSSIILGSPSFYAGGGGGSNQAGGIIPVGGLGGGGTGMIYNAAGQNTPGTPNTGGGGGGGGNADTGKSGGSGIVIIRYRTS
jgi:hypothetical protein